VRLFGRSYLEVWEPNTIAYKVVVLHIKYGRRVKSVWKEYRKAPEPTNLLRNLNKSHEWCYSKFKEYGLDVSLPERGTDFVPKTKANIRRLKILRNFLKNCRKVKDGITKSLKCIICN
jgi:hypothetical protein